MSIKFTNNASSKLTQALTTSATSMQIKAEDVSKFPVLGAGDYCLLTLVGDNSNHEVVKVTNISSDGTCTIERAQDFTTAKEWPIDNRVELRITAEYLNSTTTSEDVLSLVSPIEEEISSINNNISTIEDNITNIENDISSISSAQEEIINTTIPSLPDNVTISFEGDKLQVKDIAIGGDSSDLASNRGIFNAKALSAVDLNSLINHGFYTVPHTGSTNSPGFASKLFIYRAANSTYVLQVAFGNDTSKLATRYSSDNGGTWSNWTYYINDNTIGNGIKVNNGIISVPEYEGATSSATATSGLVPPATSAERNNFLRGDGTWQQVDLSDYALKTELTKYLPLNGTAASATKLATARTIRTNLASTSTASFDGSANITPGVTGILPVANGGTGSSTEKYIKLSSISNSVTSTSTSTVASSSAVKQAYDKAVEAESKTGLPLGHIFMWPFSTPPDGCIIANGAEYSIELYGDLWNYVVAHCQPMSSFSEWETYASSHGGYCPFYAYDSTTEQKFKTPKFAPYQQLAISSANAGTYHQAGLPEIGGTFQAFASANSTGTGIYHQVVSSSAPRYNSGRIADGTGGEVFSDVVVNVSPVYGRSDTVTPESNEWIVCVVAYGRATNVGNVDVANVMSAVEQVQANPNLQGTAHITKTWKSGSSWYRVWSDGFIEQGGVASLPSVDVDEVTVTLNKPFSTTTYVANLNPGSESTNSITYRVVSCYNKTKTTFVVRLLKSANENNWYACGY